MKWRLFPKLAAVTIAGLAWQPAQADATCTGEEYARLAFLEGEWDSIWLAKNQLVGRYSFEKASGGCALLVKWKGAPATPGDGVGLIAYSPAKGRWQRFWTDDTGAWEMTSAKSSEGPLLWEGERSDPKDSSKMMRLRVSMEKSEGGTLLEGLDISRDDGKTWSPWGRFRLQRPS